MGANKLTIEYPLPIISSPPIWQQKALYLDNLTDWQSMSFDPAFAAGVLDLGVFGALGDEPVYPAPTLNLSLFTSLAGIGVTYALWNQPTLTCPATVKQIALGYCDGVVVVDMSACTNMVQMDWSATNDGITTPMTTVHFPTTMSYGFTGGYSQTDNGPITTLVCPPVMDAPLIQLSGHSLTEASVNALLISLAAGTTNGGTLYLNAGLNASPTGDGLVALATLSAPPRNWTISYNSGGS